LLLGLDDIGVTERYADAMQEFEQRLDAEMPWLSGANLKQLVA
jgi:hypothetical protein